MTDTDALIDLWAEHARIVYACLDRAYRARDLALAGDLNAEFLSALSAPLRILKESQ